MKIHSTIFKLIQKIPCGVKRWFGCHSSHLGGWRIPPSSTADQRSIVTRLKAWHISSERSSRELQFYEMIFSISWCQLGLMAILSDWFRLKESFIYFRFDFWGPLAPLHMFGDLGGTLEIIAHLCRSLWRRIVTIIYTCWEHWEVSLQCSKLRISSKQDNTSLSPSRAYRLRSHTRPF